MEAYTSFARVYDTFMDNVPYKEWADYLGKILKEYGIDDGLVLDLGCGTGSMTEMLASSGYDMIGVDNAEEMLEIAMEKKVESGLHFFSRNNSIYKTMLEKKFRTLEALRKFLTNGLLNYTRTCETN